MKEGTAMISTVVSVMPSQSPTTYWDSRAAFYAKRAAVAQQYEDEVREFQKKIDADLEGYWTARRAVTSDDIAVRLEMAKHLIAKLAKRIDELEANQYDPYDR